MASPSQNFSTLAQSVTASIQEWKETDVRQRALTQLEDIPNLSKQEIVFGERRILFTDRLAMKMAAIDLGLVSAAMQEKHVVMLHASLGLESSDRKKLGLGFMHHAHDRNWLPDRNYGVLNFCNRLEEGDAFKELKERALKEGLHVGFRPLPVTGHSTMTDNHDGFRNRTQPVLTFSTSPLEEKPAEAYSRYQYPKYFGEQIGFSMITSFNRRNAGPVVKLEELAPPQPKPPGFFARLLGHGAVESYRITA